MPNIKLPDGKEINFDKPITGLDIAEKISKSLAKQATVISINDELKAFGLDLSDLEIEIYNRWGEMVYKNILTEMSWDGKFLGVQLPNGTYVYRVFDENEMIIWETFVPGAPEEEVWIVEENELMELPLI